MRFGDRNFLSRFLPSSVRKLRIHQVGVIAMKKPTLQKSWWIAIGVLVLLLTITGSFAACLHCDSQECCEETETEDERCWCACAFQALSSSLISPAAEEDLQGTIDLTPYVLFPQHLEHALYRPPRITLPV